MHNILFFIYKVIQFKQETPRPRILLFQTNNDSSPPAPSAWSPNWPHQPRQYSPHWSQSPDSTSWRASQRAWGPCTRWPTQKRPSSWSLRGRRWGCSCCGTPLPASLAGDRCCPLAGRWWGRGGRSKGSCCGCGMGRRCSHVPRRRHLGSHLEVDSVVE